nr:MAG TPA_asm: hypothetical protein [Caudoviricetes sp.]
MNGTNHLPSHNSIPPNIFSEEASWVTQGVSFCRYLVYNGKKYMWRL